LHGFFFFADAISGLNFLGEINFLFSTGLGDGVSGSGEDGRLSSFAASITTGSSMTSSG
jgi:hypothetical protein